MRSRSYFRTRANEILNRVRLGCDFSRPSNSELAKAARRRDHTRPGRRLTQLDGAAAEEPAVGSVPGISTTSSLPSLSKSVNFPPASLYLCVPATAAGSGAPSHAIIVIGPEVTAKACEPLSFQVP